MLSWTWKTLPTFSTGNFEWNIEFTSNGTHYDKLLIRREDTSKYIGYCNGTACTLAYDNGWVSTAYRSIVFDTLPDSDLYAKLSTMATVSALISKVEVNGVPLLDISKDTVTADTLAKGYSAHDASGNRIIGKLTGGGADQPKLYAPEIKITGDTLTITHNTNNGAFATEYNCYKSVDGGDFELYRTMPSAQLELDLTAVGLPEGDFQFKATAVGTNFQDSDASNIENYTNIWYTQDGTNLKICRVHGAEKQGSNLTIKYSETQ